MQEDWRNIEGFDGYQVSINGEVRSLDRYVKHPIKGMSLLKSQIIRSHNNGKTIHQIVHLCKDGKPYKRYVHRLVAFAFPEICGEYFDGAECNHKDENPANNNAYNLEWVTHRQNNLYGTKIERQREKLKGRPFYGNQYVDENHNRLIGN